MKDAYDKLKIWSEVLRNNWPIVLLLCGALGSVATNVGQLFGYQEIEEELVQTQNQVTEVAKHFTKTKVIIKDNCSNCESLYFKHKEDDH